MRLFALVSVLTASALALSVPSTLAVHEKRHAEPKMWTKQGGLESSSILPMRIGLKQSNLDKGHDLLMDLSSHDSPRYSQWYSTDEVVDLFAPAKETVDAVRAWLEDAGVAAHRISQSANKQWLQFDASVDEAESLLNTKYHNFEHTHSGRVQVACDEYHLPTHIQKHIDYVQPGLRLMAGGSATENPGKKPAIDKRGFRTSSNGTFGGPILGAVLKDFTQPLVNGKPDLSGCASVMTPACIAALYNISAGTLATPGNELGIFEEGDKFSSADLLEFLTLFTHINPLTSPTVNGIDGGTAPTLIGGPESDLDLQISYPIITPQNSIIFQTDDDPTAEGRNGGGGFLNTFFDAIDGSYCTSEAYGEKGNDPTLDPPYPDPELGGYKGQLQCGVYQPTNVISISYGLQEDDLPAYYEQRQCAEIMKLGLQGISVVIASGDSGVAARGTDGGNKDGCLGPQGTVFNPDFPASCPYVTSVGSTVLPAGAAVDSHTEMATTRFPSGGGFSNIFSRPSFQDAAVSSYFADHDPGYPSYNTSGTSSPSNATTQFGKLIYNRGGRGYPDIAAIGDNVLIVNTLLPATIGGTSAAAPVFAAILTRINEERLAAGKKTVGFVNPVLYANPAAFHDVVKGNNSGCGTPGFYAVKGWDPVSGLGTPDYPALLKLFTSLP